MQRDMDLVRRILLKIENSPPTRFGTDDIKFADYPQATVREHIRLLAEGGFVGGVSNALSDGSVRFISLHLTWQGYEFLDAARDTTLWERTKALVKDKGGAVPFEVIKSLLIKGVSAAVGLS